MLVARWRLPAFFAEAPRPVPDAGTRIRCGGRGGMTQAEVRPRRGGAGRAGRRKIKVLEAAGRVIAERGADATRFADVVAESAVPVSTLQYYFGSRGDLLVAAFRHASATEIAALEAELGALDDPWEELARIVTRALDGYRPSSAVAGRLWIESWHFGIRDAEDARGHAAGLRGLARPGRGRGPARHRQRAVHRAAAAGADRGIAWCGTFAGPAGSPGAAPARAAARASPRRPGCRRRSAAAS